MSRYVNSHNNPVRIGSHLPPCDRDRELAIVCNRRPELPCSPWTAEVCSDRMTMQYNFQNLCILHTDSMTPPHKSPAKSKWCDTKHPVSLASIIWFGETPACSKTFNRLRLTPTANSPSRKTHRYGLTPCDPHSSHNHQYQTVDEKKTPICINRSSTWPGFEPRIHVIASSLLYKLALPLLI